MAHCASRGSKEEIISIFHSELSLSSLISPILSKNHHWEYVKEKNMRVSFIPKNIWLYKAKYFWEFHYLFLVSFAHVKFTLSYSNDLRRRHFSKQSFFSLNPPASFSLTSIGNVWRAKWIRAGVKRGSKHWRSNRRERNQMNFQLPYAPALFFFRLISDKCNVDRG